MKYLKVYENENIDYIICELIYPEKYAGNIHLLKRTNTNNLDDSYSVTALKPTTSKTFFIFYQDDKYVTTEYGFQYNVLYETDDINDAHEKYDLLSDANEFNV